MIYFLVITGMVLSLVIGFIIGSNLGFRFGLKEAKRQIMKEFDNLYGKRGSDED